MKSTVLKSTLSIVLAILATCSAMSNAYAEAYLWKTFGDDWNWVTYTGKESLPSSFSAMNTELGNDVFFMRYYSPWNTSYVGMEGTGKETGRAYVFKLQNHAQGEDIVFPSRPEAENFCDRLILAAHGMTPDKKPNGETLLVSGWAGLGVPRKALAVAYRVPYEGEYDGKLTRAKKYWICPNPMNWVQDPSVDDENESKGIRASGLSNSELFNADTDINGRYHVACMDPNKPETDFFWFFGDHWFNGTYMYDGKRSPVLEDIDSAVGVNYCKEGG